MRFLDEIGLELRISRFGGARPCGLGEYEEPAGMRRLELGDGLPQVVAVSAGDVHHGAQILAVHHREAFLGRGGPAELARPAESAGAGDVRVEVDHRIAGARHARFGGVQHALRVRTRRPEAAHSRRVLRGGGEGQRGPTRGRGDQLATIDVHAHSRARSSTASTSARRPVPAPTPRSFGASPAPGPSA